jgi:hypothetical protein
MDSTTLTIPTSETALTVQPCGWSPDELRAMVAQEIELRAIIVDYYRSQMVGNKHYYTLQAGQKPALSKEGALNLCSLFKVRVAAQAPCEQYHGDGHYSVRYRVHLVSMRSGEVIADGDASCSTRESKYAYRWVKASDVPPFLDTAALTTRKGRYGTLYRVPTPDLADHYNTVLKMAYKRAIVAAALCLPLVSELFTQDLEETQLPSHAVPDQAPPTTPEQAPPHQLKQLWSRIHQHGINPEVFRAYLARLGLSSTQQLTPEQLDQCLSEIDTRQAEAFQPTDDTELLPASQATRTTLAEALATLQGELEQARQQGALDQLDTDWLDKLAQWAPVVKAACESPGTPEAELSRYLQDTHQVLSDLRQMLTTEAAA